MMMMTKEKEKEKKEACDFILDEMIYPLLNEFRAWLLTIPTDSGIRD